MKKFLGKTFHQYYVQKKHKERNLSYMGESIFSQGQSVTEHWTNQLFILAWGVKRKHVLRWRNVSGKRVVRTLLTSRVRLEIFLTVCGQKCLKPDFLR